MKGEENNGWSVPERKRTSVGELPITQEQAEYLASEKSQFVIREQRKKGFANSG